MRTSSVLRLLLPIAAGLVLAGCASSMARRARPDLSGQTYVITGASSGIGRGVALRLAALRANVVLAARRTELLNEVAAQASAAGGTPLVVTTDVSVPNDMGRLAEAALARFGRIDVWINNAGVGAIGRFEDIPLEDHAKLVDTNLKGVIYGSHVAIRQFKKQGGGTLVNIGSVESESPLAYHASYSATKHAVLGLGRALNEEMRLDGFPRIAVATVMPWATDTPFFDHAANYSAHAARMPAMDGPEKAVDAIVHASLFPREEVPVGWKARAALAAHWLTPDLAERTSANIVHKHQFELAPPAPATSGSVRQPVATGAGVDGGMRARMQREQAEREHAR